MTITTQVQILNEKITANKAQYDLDRKTAKISALSSGELEKYESLTGEDLGRKLKVLENVKFQHSPLGEAFNKALKKMTKIKKLLNAAMI